MVGAGEGAACAQTCNPANCSIKRAKIRTVAIRLGSWVRCYMEHEVVRGGKNRALVLERRASWKISLGEGPAVLPVFTQIVEPTLRALPHFVMWFRFQPRRQEKRSRRRQVAVVRLQGCIFVHVLDTSLST